MCGSTGAQTQLQQEQMDAYKQAQAMTAEEYAHQQAIYAPMAKQFQSIFSMGPSQEGMAAGEKDVLTSQAIEGTATNYAAAAKAVGEQMAARGGGNADITSGGEQQMKGEVAQSAAGELSREESQITQADYEKGYNQWLQASQGLTNIAAGENPLGYEQAATGAGSAAGTTANEIAQQQNSWINAAVGAAGAIGSSAITAKWG